MNPTTFPPFTAGTARLYLMREVKKPTDPTRASHPSRSRTRCDPSGRCRYQGAETPPGHCDATPATAAPRQCIRGRTPTGSSSPGAGHGAFMYAAHAQRKQGCCVFAQGARLVDGVGIEVDVGVIALDTLHDKIHNRCATNPRPQSTAGPGRSATVRCAPAPPPASRRTARPTAPGVCVAAVPRNSRSVRSPCR